MSFIAGLILTIIEDDEPLAWIIFLKVLSINNWRRLYTYETPKLFELTKALRTFINDKLPRLNETLKQHNVILESLFASPFLTLFANLIPMEQTLRVLDKFILCKIQCMIFNFNHRW